MFMMWMENDEHLYNSFKEFVRESNYDMSWESIYEFAHTYFLPEKTHGYIKDILDQDLKEDRNDIMEFIKELEKEDNE